jgi:hypothetical protein
MIHTSVLAANKASGYKDQYIPKAHFNKTDGFDSWEKAFECENWESCEWAETDMYNDIDGYLNNRTSKTPTHIVDRRVLRMAVMSGT